MSTYQQPDARGHFGPYGGSFVAETLVHALDELKRSYAEAQRDPAFAAEFRSELAHFVGRPSPIYHAARLSRELGGAQIHLKREDLNHTGAHKINNTIGQAMLARRMGKPRVIAETGAGQHGVATATICARYGLECVVYMGSEDVKRQSPNVYRMHLLGATVVPVESGSKTLKDALNEALRDWVTNVENTFYIIGTVAGPHPYPMMVRDFQRVIGDECLVQMP
ncbi:MAG: pyridoxal-phosphate dependent enzyme, partial [Caldimonas sp.]